jgi:hypothetical protein
MQLELFSTSEVAQQRADHRLPLSQQQRVATVATLARWMARLVRPQQGVAPMSGNVLPALSKSVVRGAPHAAVEQRRRVQSPRCKESHA